MFPFLKIDTTLATKTSSGAHLWTHQWLIKFSIQVRLLESIHLNNSIISPSGPACLLFLVVLSADSYSSNVTRSVLNSRCRACMASFLLISWMSRLLQCFLSRFVAMVSALSFGGTRVPSRFHTYIYTNIYIFIHIYKYTYIYICIYIYVYIYICTNTNNYEYIYTHIYEYIYIYIYVYTVYILVNIYIYTKMYFFLCICAYIYIQWQIYTVRVYIFLWNHQPEALSVQADGRWMPLDADFELSSDFAGCRQKFEGLVVEVGWSAGNSVRGEAPSKIGWCNGFMAPECRFDWLDSLALILRENQSEPVQI